MKLIKTEDAVGHVLCHDITQIIKGVTKDAVFRKGHVVQKEDIPVLLSVGKEHLYVWEKREDMLHEDEAALILYEICVGNHMHAGEIKEGKIELIADCDGLLKVDSERLRAINMVGEMMIATRHGNTTVHKGDKLAGTRVIPLIIEKKRMEHARGIAEEYKKNSGGLPMLDVKPFLHKKVGIVTTGSEVYHGRIEDTFTPVILEKLAQFDTEIIGQKICDDDPAGITAAIQEWIQQGANLVICTGGMSVDPDDRTPLAIKNACSKDQKGHVVSYGAPVLPGAMFLLAYHDDGIPVIGLPGCVMYAKRTIFDLILPRLMADEKLTAADINCLGEGGLCLSCEVCTFPNCGFGK
ncbi:MAG: molybdopterin-binding protein [bacterium]|nr:molybdopterin-binding protein [bacterium]